MRTATADAVYGTGAGDAPGTTRIRFRTAAAVAWDVNNP